MMVNKQIGKKFKIRAMHKFTGRSVMLYYPSLADAQKCNPAMEGFEYV
jgi:hypothetical protein